MSLHVSSVLLSNVCRIKPGLRAASGLRIVLRDRQERLIMYKKVKFAQSKMMVSFYIVFFY